MTPEAFSALIPISSTGYIANWFQEHRVELSITNNRSSKYGDYRRGTGDIPPRITVNKGLNQYEFLLTLVHEMAHHGVTRQGWYFLKRSAFSRIFGKTNPGPRPHGIEWKNNYRLLMEPLLNSNVFPEDLLSILNNHFRNPKATTKGDITLVMAMKKYDFADGLEFIEHLPVNSPFHLPDGRSFVKKEKLRKRYRCHSLDSKKVYLFSPIAKVIPGKSASK